MGGFTTPKGHSIWTGAKLRPTAISVSELKAQPIQTNSDDALSLNKTNSVKPENTNVTKPVDINKLEQTFIKTKGVDGNVKYVATDEMVAVRHHTSAKALKSIQKSELITPTARNGAPWGVDVEAAPFVSPKNFNAGQFGKGAFIEFMVPRSQLSAIPGYMGGTGNVARIITNAAPLNVGSSQSVRYVNWNWLGLW